MLSVTPEISWNTSLVQKPVKNVYKFFLRHQFPLGNFKIQDQPKLYIKTRFKKLRGIMP